MDNSTPDKSGVLNKATFQGLCGVGVPTRPMVVSQILAHDATTMP